MTFSSDSNCTNYQFTQKNNPTTGRLEWVANTEDEHDYFSDIARSSYADMLHDKERNELYYQAINEAVRHLHKEGRRVKVLDIGTGTGLLSMMAAKAGADVITAIEVFKPMSKVAEKVTKLNGFPQIKVINKHSTNISIGVEEADMEEKANLLITELFDTELIGEGALSSYQHAHENLMEEDSLAVPHRAAIWAVLVDSPLMCSWNELGNISIPIKGGNVVEVKADPKMVESRGLPAVHDIQLSLFPREELTELTKSFEVFRFDWSDKSISDASRSCDVQIEAVCDGKGQVVLSWWDLEMDRDGKIVLSTAPHWHHPTPAHMQWRDHWLQSVYFLPQVLQCHKGDVITVTAFHDAYSLRFEAGLDHVTPKDLPDYPPRMLLSRPRMGRLNDHSINEVYVRALESISETLPADGIVLCFSDLSLLPLLVAQLCHGRDIVTVESSKKAQRGVSNLVCHNNLNVEVLCGRSPDIAADLDGRKVSLLCGEPHFTSSLLPWHDLYFWYVRSQLSLHLHSSAKIMPCTAHLCAAAVWFKDLWKIRAPVGVVEGFDLSPMDKMIDEALDKKEYHEPEPHALWEYTNKLLTTPCKFMTFDLTNKVPEKEVYVTGKMNFLEEASHLTCHGIVLWMEYELDATHSVSTGLLPPGCPPDSPWKFPKWSAHNKQAVFLFKTPLENTHTSNITYDVTFVPSSGDVNMKFNVIDCL